MPESDLKVIDLVSNELLLKNYFDRTWSIPDFTFSISLAREFSILLICSFNSVVKTSDAPLHVKVHFLTRPASPQRRIPECHGRCVLNVKMSTYLHDFSCQIEWKKH